MHYGYTGMANKKPKKAQSSLEYLITYGWALIMIATIIGVLAFATGGGINTNSCTTFLTIICKGIGADGDTLILILQNTTGQKITINPFTDIMFDNHQGYAEILYQDRVYRFEDVTIGAGDEFTIQGKGMVLADTLTITYYEHRTGLTKTLTSNLSTDAPDNIELSNDGIDNDGDGLVDCLDPILTDCEYTVEATAFGAPITVDNIGAEESIAFGQVKGSSETNITNNSQAQNTAILGFYVDSLTGPTTATVSFSGNSNPAVEIETGWNEAEISLGGAVLLWGADIPVFTIKSNTANSFTVSNDPLPQTILIVNPWP